MIIREEKEGYYLIKCIGAKPKAKRRKRTVRHIFLAKQTIELGTLSIPSKYQGKRFRLKLEFIDDTQKL